MLRNLRISLLLRNLHIDFIPYITESKRGVDTRVSLKQALGALGFKGGSRGDTELNQWINSEKQQLAIVMQRHGIEWEQKDTHEEHLSVLEFKKKERAKEVAELEAEKADAEIQKDKAVKEAESASKKAIPFVEKMKDILFSLYLEYCRLQDKYQKLSRDYNDMWNRKERLQNRCEFLEERIEEMETVEKDYGRVRKIFGPERVDSLVREMKEMERLQLEAENERRKVMKRKQRDVR